MSSQIRFYIQCTYSSNLITIPSAVECTYRQPLIDLSCVNIIITTAATRLSLN